MYVAAGEKASQRLFENVRITSTPRSALTWSRTTAFAIASLVHGLTLGLVALGVWLLVQAPVNLFSGMSAALCLGLAWMLRPRLARVPSEAVSRWDFPALYRLVDDVGRALGSRGADAIVIGLVRADGA